MLLQNNKQTQNQPMNPICLCGGDGGRGVLKEMIGGFAVGAV